MKGRFGDGPITDISYLRCTSPLSGVEQTTSARILQVIAISADAMASAFSTSQPPDKFRNWRVGTKAESLQPLLRNGGAVPATQALNSDTLHAR